MTKKDAKELFDRYLNGKATPQEAALIERAYAHFAEPASGDLPHSREDAIMAALDNHMTTQLSKSTPSKVGRLAIYMAAAILLIAISVGLYFYSYKSRPESATLLATEVPPGGNRATLLLGDGRTISLSEDQAGIVIGDGIKYADGSDVFADGEAAFPATTARMVTISTPKGGTYQLRLSDGSEIWLNASSSLRYPIKFDDQQRMVELTGEGYFAIAKDKQRPFRVHYKNQVVTVLGTEFNIAAYPDEPTTKTTLVTGAVEIFDQQSRAIDKLSPGQQAISSGGNTSIQRVNVQQYTAWKDGYFYFSGSSPQEAFTQLSNWYDVAVSYKKEIPKVAFFGKVERNMPLDSLLEILRTAGFDVEARPSAIHRAELIIGK
ncbi:FecR family protein [Parapedobacter indicus]|uniref:FecR family protein n=1 Tax=Parapedobacter indicus TaxID=1477437 RepID=A0A1I3T9M6_9SPHI|nr:FecR family protein [Parapedobacter indicus]PPK99623.1 FecR family protein [Parapedobacter indicus]SFJ66197.1 FecR family protein [Parapedobacter indicus]